MPYSGSKEYAFSPEFHQSKRCIKQLPDTPFLTYRTDPFRKRFRISNHNLYIGFQFTSLYSEMLHLLFIPLILSGKFDKENTEFVA